MSISIKAVHIELTPALKDYTEKRLRAIEKYTGSEPEVVVEIGQSTTHHKQGNIFIAEVHVTTALGKQHHAVSEKADLYEAIDDVRNEIISALSSAKGKQATLFKRGAQKIKKLLRGFR